MAVQTAVNGQITDFVTQTNTNVLGNKPVYSPKKLAVAIHQALVKALPTPGEWPSDRFKTHTLKAL